MKVTVSLLSSFMFYFNDIPLREDRFSIPYNSIVHEVKEFHWGTIFSVDEFQLEDKKEFLDFLKKSPDVSDFTDLSEVEFEKYIKNIRYKFFVCRLFENSKIVAFLLADIIQFDYKEELYIRALGVDFEYRRFGLATKLLDHAQNFAKQNNYKSLSIYASNDLAKKCYQKFGFMQDLNCKNRSEKRCKCCIYKWMYKTI